jgi:hypothetical protein
MEDLFADCLAFTLQAEGGFVDNPADPGGATNMGVTLATFRQWLDDPRAGAGQLRDMARSTAAAIYRGLYWNPLRADLLPPGVDLMVFDFGVNAGIWRSARLLQRAIGFSVRHWMASSGLRRSAQRRFRIPAISWRDWQPRRRRITEACPSFQPSGTGGSTGPDDAKRLR